MIRRMELDRSASRKHTTTLHLAMLIYARSFAGYFVLFFVFFLKQNIAVCVAELC